MTQLKVVMLGESLARQGGIVSVEKLILQQATPDIRINHIATLIDGSSLQKAIAFGQAMLTLVWKLLSSKVDLLHIHVSERGSAFRQAITTLIALLFLKPVVMHAHGAEFHFFYAKLPQWIKQGLSWVFRRCDRFVVVSESWKNFYVQELGLKPERVVVLPNPVKIPQQVPARDNSSNKVFFISLGRIGERKGAFDLIHAFSNLADDQKEVSKLVLAGDGEVEKARRLINSLDLSSCITVLDWIDAEQRDALLSEADVFVLPTYNEGLPLAILEAMSWGLPVITTPVGGIPELIFQYKNGLLIEPGHIQQLTEAMQLLIEDKALRLSLGRSARENVAPFDIEIYFGSLKDIYISTLTKEGLANNPHKAVHN